MSAFWPLALFFLLLSLVFVLLPWRSTSPAKTMGQPSPNLALLRDQLHELDSELKQGLIDASAYWSAREELELRTAEEVLPSPPSRTPFVNARAQASIIAALFTVGAVSLYFFIGTPRALDTPAAPPEVLDRITSAQAETMVERLAVAMKSDPGNVRGWQLLATAYTALERYGEAVDAYRHLVDLTPDNADAWAGYADVQAVAQGKSVIGEPERLAARALAIDPDNVKALMLSASGQSERGDYASSLNTWKKVAALVPADSETGRLVAGKIDETQALASTTASVRKDMQIIPAAQEKQGSAVASSTLKGTVEVAPALLNRIAPGDTLFIFARAPDGPRFPLAVLRTGAARFPFSFRLDDSMAMTDAKLSSYPAVIVGARISRSGNAMPSSGDLEGSAGEVAAGSQNIHLIIDRLRD